MKNTKLLLGVSIIYLVFVTVSILYSWVLGIHVYDLSLTVSIYVGLHPWTSVFYLIGAIVISLLLWMYVWKSPAGFLQKIIYSLTIFCTLGCAVFPCTSRYGAWVEDIHNLFAYVLVLLAALTLLLMLILARNKKQRIFAVAGSAYALVFIAAFVCNIEVLKDTILIWENGLFFIFFFELYMEKDGIRNNEQGICA